MDSGYGATMYGVNPMGYATVETLLDDVSRQMASSNLTRRYSRGSASQRTNGTMRVVKPSSASNSPRGSTGLGRRRTVNTDSPYHRRVMMGEQYMAGAMVPSMDGRQISKTNRPVSWHPSMGAPQMQQSVSPMQRYDTRNGLSIYDFPPTPAVYSGYTSPSSNFSPVSMPFTGCEQQQFIYPPSSTAFYSTMQDGDCYPTTSAALQPQNYTGTLDMDNSMYSHFDWSNFATNGFENSTAPPTPENFLPIQHPDPLFPSEESIPYHALSDSEGDGEELIGMGLYDTPDIAKSPAADPQFDNYRALMMSQLLGSNYRRNEPTGKGLKLEDAWDPPASDDGEAEDEDGEGEDDEDVVEPQKGEADDSSSVQTSLEIHPRQAIYTQSYDRTGWL
ncbi:hypothetical protein BP5796_00583 [Coleophoma crateriformis]|uniref:Uncharacterized protein n=1 Tax=Coleophoma crateriformis TaxID=565419 RepID=A0A3D8T8D9_9HELO|nr:hypothetical protein BP5796_00583 [Coleophoma crateriformis]